MCFYKENKPPCICKIRYLARPCWRATFYRSCNSNPNPIVQVCGVVETARDVPPRSCHDCESLAALMEAQAAAQATRPVELRLQERRQRRQQRRPRRSSYGLDGLNDSVSSLSLSSSHPAGVSPLPPVLADVNQNQNQHHRPRKQSQKTSAKRSARPPRRATMRLMGKRQQKKKPQKQQQQQQQTQQPVLISITKPEPEPATCPQISEFFNFSSFDDATPFSDGIEGIHVHELGERLNQALETELENPGQKQQQQQQSGITLLAPATAPATPPQTIDPRVLLLSSDFDFDDVPLQKNIGELLGLP
ncbi:hypothetical protein VTN77DRAFT_219 [Rasamsonia byssochlamydoides]|uniref:uncharacterized protein n=1 Tax=Rasamsonia byssochlamydoides TaxID=89139 RepID=UPI00374402D8